jgi:hypothetical protein
MLELGEQLRDFIDSGVTPIAPEEVMAVEYRFGGATFGGPPQRPILRTGVYAALVAVVAAALVVICLVLPNSKVGPGVTPASAATVLNSAAAQAQAQKPLVPGPSQYLYVRTLVSGINGGTLGNTSSTMVWYDVQEVWQTWSSPLAAGVTHSEVVGQPEFITGADRASWVAAGSPPLLSGYSGGGSPPYYDVLRLPTHPSEIEAYFAEQPGLPSSPTVGHDAAWQFTTAAAFLQNGASSAQRAALLRYMSTIPGVRLIGTATSIGTDRKGSVLSIPSDTPGLSVQAILDTQSSELVEVRYVVTNPTLYAAATSGLRSEALNAGQVRNYSDFIYVGIANSSGSVPVGAPVLPIAWPFGTTREPLPGSLYP